MSEQANDAIAKSTWLFVAVGFASLGLLVGSVAGLSSAALTLPLFGFLFALAGGSVIAFMGNVPRPLVGLAGVALASFCLTAVIALYLGLYIKVNGVLFKHPIAAVAGGQGPSTTPPSVAASSRGQALSTPTAMAAIPSGQGPSTIPSPTQPAAQQGFPDVLRSNTQPSEDYLRGEVARGNIKLRDACKELGLNDQK